MRAVRLAVLVALLSMAVVAEDKPAPRLTQAQVAQLNDATKDIQIADLQRQVAEAKRKLILAQACSEASIPLAKCVVDSDGTLRAKPEVPKK